MGGLAGCRCNLLSSVGRSDARKNFGSNVEKASGDLQYAESIRFTEEVRATSSARECADAINRGCATLGLTSRRVARRASIRRPIGLTFPYQLDRTFTWHRKIQPLTDGQCCDGRSEPFFELMQKIIRCSARLRAGSAPSPARAELRRHCRPHASQTVVASPMVDSRRITSPRA